jgi:hypothetical protein
MPEHSPAERRLLKGSSPPAVEPAMPIDHRVRGFVCVALSTVAIYGSAGCSSKGARAPEGTRSAEARSLVGSDPQFAFVARLDRLRADLVYAPMLREMSKKKDLEALFDGVTIVDAFGTFDGQTATQASMVLTVRSGPARSELPDGWRSELEKRDVGHALATGVWEYATIGADGWPYGLYSSQHDWVFLAGRAAGHGHDWFSTHASPPPPIDFGDDVLLGVWLGPGAMKGPAMKNVANEPGSRGLEGASIIVRDGVHGDLLYTGNYATSADADEAIRVTTDRIGMYASVWKSTLDSCPGLGVLAIENESSGRTVRLRVTHIPQALRAAMDCYGEDKL